MTDLLGGDELLSNSIPELTSSPAIISSPDLEELIYTLKNTAHEDLRDIVKVQNWEPFEIKWNSLRRDTIHLNYLQQIIEDGELQDEIQKYNREHHRLIRENKKKLIHHYLIFKFNHPKLIPGYQLMIRERMARLGYEVIVTQ